MLSFLANSSWVFFQPKGYQFSHLNFFLCSSHVPDELKHTYASPLRRVTKYLTIITPILPSSWQTERKIDQLNTLYLYHIRLIFIYIAWLENLSHRYNTPPICEIISSEWKTSTLLELTTYIFKLNRKYGPIECTSIQYSRIESLELE